MTSEEGTAVVDNPGDDAQGQPKSADAPPADVEQLERPKEPKPRRKRNIILETALVAVVTSVAATVVQKLLFGESSIAVSVFLTVMMEVLYFTTIGKRTQSEQG